MCPKSRRWASQAVDVPYKQNIQRFQHYQQNESFCAKELSILDFSATWLQCFFANAFTHKEQQSNGLNLVNN